MKIISCKWCGKRIPVKTNCCPLCGSAEYSEPFKSSKWEGFCGIAVLLMVAIWFVITSYNTTNHRTFEQAPKDLSVPLSLMIQNDMILKKLIMQNDLIKPYSITGIHDISLDNRRRIELWITANQAKTRKEKLATLAWIAKKQLEKYQANLIVVMLDGNSIKNTIIVNYAPDHKGIYGKNIGVDFVIDDLPSGTYQ